ncbi:hypothetical protein AQUCO_00200045v1 [Aquilegia coerulea]|uniref:DUF1421 domain-containing protein n=1 Tax=Aquilegia coerulea TaxID=218851 RepID=A0A2G5F191_AQUCA|nr:hypothetical protein AQUCO_00200045v1 [Aquilegia coerulea]
MDRNGISIFSEIDRTLKKHTDNLLHTLEGVSARLSNLEIRTCDIETSLEDMKEHVGNYDRNRKLRQMENMLNKVQEGLRIWQEKQEIVEALKYANSQGCKEDKRSESQNSIADTGSAQGKISAPYQSHQSLTTSVPQTPQQLPGLLSPVASQAPVQQSPSLVQPPPRLPQSQIPAIPQPEPYFPTPCQPAGATRQQYQFPPPQQLKIPPPTTCQQYESVHQHSQPSQPSQQHPPVVSSSQHQLPLSYHSEETSYMPQPPKTYPPTPSVNQLPPIPQPVGCLPYSQQFYGARSNMYSSGFSSTYAPPHSLSQYNAAIKPPHGSSTDPSSGGSQRHLHTAQLLPHALPTANSNDRGSSTSGTENEVPIDDVVDKVVMMGFSRDQVRATVNELSKKGKSVDFNAVLDKLMNQ